MFPIEKTKAGVTKGDMFKTPEITGYESTPLLTNPGKLFYGIAIKAAKQVSQDKEVFDMLNIEDFVTLIDYILRKALKCCRCLSFIDSWSVSWNINVWK